MLNKQLTVVLSLLLAACHQSDVQSRYNDDRTECRAFAEEKQGRIGSQGNIAVRNAELVTIFSDCMAQNGWQVATPRREGGAVTTKGGALPGVSTPASVGATGTIAAAPAATNLGTRAAIANANRGAPATAQQAAPRVVQQQPQPTQLQPAPQQVAPRVVQQQPQPTGGAAIRRIPEENYF